jgi:quercetin dioxygenase-like cupin family protein
MRLLAAFLWAAVAAVPIWILNSPIVAQTAGQGPIRTVLALGRVPSLVDAPMHFKFSRVSIPAGATVVYRGDHSTIYLLSGTLAVTTGNDKRTLQPAEGAFLPSGVDVTLQAEANAAAEILQYQLMPAANMAKQAMSTPASVTELHRMRIPANSLKPGPHEFSMIRVTLPAGAPRPRPHTRSGAALYYVLAEGAITIWPSATVDTLTGESRTEPRSVGAIQEEPFGFIHSWSSKADAALILLQANVSQEGVPEILFVK